MDDGSTSSEKLFSLIWKEKKIFFLLKGRSTGPIRIFDCLYSALKRTSETRNEIDTKMRRNNNKQQSSPTPCYLAIFHLISMFTIKLFSKHVPCAYCYLHRVAKVPKENFYLIYCHFPNVSTQFNKNDQNTCQTFFSTRNQSNIW